MEREREREQNKKNRVGKVGRKVKEEWTNLIFYTKGTLSMGTIFK